MEGPEPQSSSPALSVYLMKDYISIHKFPPITGSGNEAYSNTTIVSVHMLTIILSQ